MRNLKKILALVLALVMSMSLMATANAFTDDANVDATYDEAVTVLSNLKVFQGYDDGSFQPKGSITRAEVAAIIYRIATGDVTDSQVGIYADYNKFDDVKSTSWYAGYVNYCANAEYIKGYDAKTFGPNDPVTGYQALAMILRAVGYDKNGEFTGSNWQVQTASVGKQLHITDKVSAGTLGTAATREVVAEILFRSILVPQVTYTPALGYQSIGVATNANVWTGWFVDNASIGAETFGLAMTEGEISAVARTTDQVTLTTYGTASVNTPFQRDIYDVVDSTVVVGTGADWTKIGYQAYVYTVPTAGAKTRSAVSDLVITGTSLEVNTDRAGISTSQSPDAAGVRYYYNGELLDNANANSTINGKTLTQIMQTRGVKVDAIDNDGQGRYEVVVITEYTVAQVTGIATDTTTTGSNAWATNTYYFGALGVANSKLVTSDTLAVGDYVTYVEYPNSRAAAQGDYYVTKAPSATGMLTKIAEKYNPFDATYTIGGADYVKSDIPVANTSAYTSALNRYNQGENFVFYTDPYGYIIVASVASVNDFLYVYANDVTSTTSGLTPAKVVMKDGSVTTINVKTVNSVPTGNAVIAPEALTEKIYSYTVNADGSYNLVDMNANITLSSYNKGDVWWGGAGVDAASTIVDIRLMNAATTSNPVYTGYSNIPSMVNVKLTYITAADGDISLGFLTAGEADDSTEIFVYQTNSVKFDYNVGGKIGHAYMDVIVNGVKVEDCALTAEQYEDIMYYGVGIYTYHGDELVYSSYDEEWGTVTWNNDSVVFVKDGVTSRYAYSQVNFNALNITSGTATTFSLLNGGFDGLNNGRAIIRQDKSNNTVAIYFVIGELASTQVDPYYSTATQFKNGTQYVYAVANKYITSVLDSDLADLNVTFYGKDNYTTDATGVRTITVDYADALKAESSLMIHFGTQDSLVDANGTPISSIPAVPPVAGATYGLVVYDNAGVQYSYKLVVNAANKDTALYYNDRPITSPYNYVGGNTTLGGMASLFTVKGNAKVDWKFFDENNNELKDQSTTIANGYYAIATVTAENRATATYLIKVGADPATPDSVANAIKDKNSAADVTAAVKTMSTNGNDLTTKIIPALVKVGVPESVIVPSVMNVYTEANGGGNGNARILGLIIAALPDAEPEVIAEAYVNWLLANKSTANVTHPNSFNLTKNADGTYTLTIASDAGTYPSSNTGLFELVDDLNAKVERNWTSGGTLSNYLEYTYTNDSDLAGQIGSDIATLLAGTITTYGLRVTLGDTVYLINVVEGPAVGA